MAQCYSPKWAPFGSPRSLILICIIIPAVMVLTSLVFIALHDENNLFELRHSLSFRQRDSWYPMLEALGWLRGHPGGDIYLKVFFQDHTKFQYPLTALLFVSWLSPTSPHALWWLNGLNILAYFGSALVMGLLTKALVECAIGAALDVHTGRLMQLVGIIATLCFHLVLRALSLGQIQVFLDLLFFLSCLTCLQGRMVLTGALVGVSTLIKPQMGLFIIWAILRREWSFALGWLFAIAVGFGLALLHYGLGWPLGYLKVLSFISAHGEAFYPNQSPNGLANRLLGNGINMEWDRYDFAPYQRTVYTVTVAAAVVLVVWGLTSGLRKARDIRSFVTAAICFTVASPVAWDHHLAVLLPALALCFASLVSRPSGDRSRWGTVTLAAMFLMLANDWFPLVNLTADSWLNPLQCYVGFGAIGLVFALRRSPVPMEVPETDAMRGRPAGFSWTHTLMASLISGRPKLDPPVSGNSA